MLGVSRFIEYEYVALNSISAQGFRLNFLRSETAGYRGECVTEESKNGC